MAHHSTQHCCKAHEYSVCTARIGQCKFAAIISSHAQTTGQMHPAGITLGYMSCRYLPGISAAQPGLRIGFERAGLAAQFPDAVAPYCHFGCDARRRFPGTFFRFPLRCRISLDSCHKVLSRVGSLCNVRRPSRHTRH